MNWPQQIHDHMMTTDRSAHLRGKGFMYGMRATDDKAYFHELLGTSAAFAMRDEAMRSVASVVSNHMQMQFHTGLAKFTKEQ